ncbi:hypothetical protein DRQ29_02320 [bacterium]|nr:MAG: hypothetical protein DRQ29_02320 [bacterium]
MKFLAAASIVLIFAIGFVFAQNPPRELTAESNLDSRVELAWHSPLETVETVELAYDDGAGGGLDDGERNDILSVRFTPTEQCSLISVKFFGYCPYPEIPVEIGVYPDNGSGRPDIYHPLYTVEQNIITGWQEVDLSASGLTFDADEDFHIGIKKIVPPDTFYHYIVHDNDPCPEARSWMFDYSYFSFVAVPGDLQIRALVYYGSGLMALSSEGKRVEPFDSTPLERRAFIPEDVEYYIIYRGTNPDTSAFTFLEYTTDTFFTDNSVTNDVVYYYGVKAQHTTYGTSPFSNIVSAVPRVRSSTAYIDTIVLDDGEPDATAFYSEGNGFGTCFQLNQVGQLRSVLYLFNVTGQFRPQIWSADSNDFPEDILLESSSYLPVTAPGWRNVNIFGWDTIVVTEPFIVSCIVGDFYTGLAVDVSGGARSFDYGGGSWSSITDSTYMIRTILEYYDDAAYYNLHYGWNLVSLPIVLDSNSVSYVFPTAMGGIAYEWVFDTSSASWYYDTTSTLEPGKGYWIISSIDTMYIIQGGIPIHSLDVPLHSAWNLIGGISNHDAYYIYDLSTYPDTILTDHPIVYTYDCDRGAMVAANYILPGKGYFILSWGTGALQLR